MRIDARALVLCSSLISTLQIDINRYPDISNRMKKALTVLFITASAGTATPSVIEKIAANLTTRAVKEKMMLDPASSLSDPVLEEGHERIRVVVTNDSKGALSQVMQCPDEYFVVVPTSENDKRRKCLICSPLMSRAFSDDLKAATGAMIHTEAPWKEYQLEAIADQMINWLSKMTDPATPNPNPWGKQPEALPPRNKRSRAHVSNVNSPSGYPLKAERMWK